MWMISLWGVDHLVSGARAAVSALERSPRPTGLGWAFLLGTFVFGIIGVGTRDWVVLLVFGLLLATVLFSAVLPILNLRRVRVERQPMPSVHAGETFLASARISTDARGSDSIGVVLVDGSSGPYARPGHAMAVRVRPGEPAQVRYRVRIKSRGRHVIDDCVLATRYPFGLFEHTVRRPHETEILVLPRLGRFRADPLPRSRFSRRMTSTETVREKGQEEFGNLREYRPGDSPRLIAWRATARHGALMVKEMESDKTKRVTVFLESRLEEGAGTRERLRLERSISFTATLLKVLARRSYWIQVHFFGPRTQSVSAGRGARKLDRVMERLAVLEPTSKGGIHHLVRSAPEEILATSLPVLILPTFSQQRLEAALRFVPGGRAPVVFLAEGEWERSVFAYHDDSFAAISR
jgi:uncharacterized protein (DUF58 family)